MNDDKVNEHSVAIATLAAKLDGVSQQIDHYDRNQQQLVQTFREHLAAHNERFIARFDAIDRRLNEMSTAGERTATQHTAEMEAVKVRLTAVEKWQDRVSNRFIGVAIAVPLGAGSVGAALVSFVSRITS